MNKADYITLQKGEYIKMKRKYIKALKSAGIRYADKDGAKVGVNHLKLHQAINLYYEHGLNKQ